MHPRFRQYIDELHRSFEKLMAVSPCRHGELPRDMPKSGVYLFSESASHLYVGRSNDLRGRYKRHCSKSTNPSMTAFGFRLAREQLGTIAGTRSGLASQPEFAEAFETTKARIRQMEYRYVEEIDQTRQALLEIYVATVLETRYNQFATTRIVYSKDV